MKRATVYWREGQVIAVASCLTTTGLWVDCRWSAIHDAVSDLELGQVVIAALTASRGPVPNPARSELGGLVRPLLRASRTRTYAEFVAGSHAVAVELHAMDRISMAPLTNRGATGGFQPIDGSEVRILGSDPEGVGKTVRELLAIGDRESPLASG
jgi:hypothetical protein